MSKAFSKSLSLGAKRTKKSSAELSSSNIKLAQAMKAEADLLMNEQLLLVTNKLEAYCRHSLRASPADNPLPLDPLKADALISFLEKNLEPNPYVALLSGEPKESVITTERINIFLDTRLTSDPEKKTDNERFILERLDRESLGLAGSILIFHNGYDFAILTALGIDGKPLLEQCGKSTSFEHPRRRPSTSKNFFSSISEQAESNLATNELKPSFFTIRINRF